MSEPVEIDDCWRRIGVDGDGSCLELIRVTHCRNCPVYRRGGRQLLEQAAPEGYLEQWADLLARAQAEEPAEVVATVVFRLGEECLALPAADFAEVVEVPPIHSLPHRLSRTLLGLVNVRGELELCVSLAEMLGIELAADAGRPARPRLAVIERDGEAWVFPVDEVIGVLRVDRRELVPPPATVTRDDSALTAALFQLGGERVALLDGDLLFARLRRAIA